MEKKKTWKYFIFLTYSHKQGRMGQWSELVWLQTGIWAERHTHGTPMLWCSLELAARRGTSPWNQTSPSPAGSSQRKVTEKLIFRQFTHGDEIRVNVNIKTHLKDSSQDCEGTRYLYSIQVPCSQVYNLWPIGAVYNKVTVRCKPLCHTANHDTDHSKCTWTHTHTQKKLQHVGNFSTVEDKGGSIRTPQLDVSSHQ